MFPAILICAFMLKNAATQTVTATLGITKSCVLEGDEVKLLCTVSSGCCNSSIRVWQKVAAAASLLYDGTSLDSSKYMEDYVSGTTTGFNLIIKNVQKSDFGVNYQCQYGLKQSNELYLNDTLCPSSEVNISGWKCWKCAGQDYGWSILGTLMGTVIIMIIVIVNIMNIAKVKIGKPKTVLIVGGLTFIISAVVNALIALLIGYYKCHCVDGKYPWFIVLGPVTSGITGVIALIYMLKQGSSQGSNGSLSWTPVNVEQEPKNPKKPSSNEQPLKENKKKKPAAKKSSNEQPLEEKKKKNPAAETRL